MTRKEKIIDASILTFEVVVMIVFVWWISTISLAIIRVS